MNGALAVVGVVGMVWGLVWAWRLKMEQERQWRDPELETVANCYEEWRGVGE